MKKLTSIITAVIFTLVYSSCEKETMDFEGEDAIYFAVQWGPDHGDSTVWAFQHFSPIEFMEIDRDMHEVKLRVSLLGRKKDYDRPFEFQIVPDSTTAIQGLEYKINSFQGVIKADEVYTDLIIPVFRTKDIKEVEKTIGIELLSNDYFDLSIEKWEPLHPYWSSEKHQEFNPAFHMITLSDFLSKPNIWIGMANNGVEAGIWGEFTEKKFNLICELANVTYADFENSTTMPMARAQVIREVVANHLQTLYDQGKPILEDDGRLMWVMGVSWTTTIGVPWK